MTLYFSVFFFFFNDTATTEIYTLSLHDALPISALAAPIDRLRVCPLECPANGMDERPIRLGYVGAGFIAQSIQDRKSTRLNSSHANISYAVFCLKKKKKKKIYTSKYDKRIN